MSIVTEQDRGPTWVRLQIPNEWHLKLKARAKEERKTLREVVLQAIGSSLDEQIIAAQLIKFFDQNAEDIEVVRREDLVSLRWESEGSRKTIIYDSVTGELFHNLDTVSPGNNSVHK